MAYSLYGVRLFEKGSLSVKLINVTNLYTKYKISDMYVPSCRYIKLKMMLAPFKENKYYPGHFEHEVTETTTIHGLKCLIENHLDDSVNSVALFKDSSCSKESYLDPGWCLGHCGIEGGPKDALKSAEIFYDYFPLNSGCPILMDDSHIPNFII